METLNYKVLAETGYNGYILKDAPVKVMQFGEGNFLRAFVDYFYDIANEKAGYNGKVKLVQPIGNFPQMADWINEQEGQSGYGLVFRLFKGDDEIRLEHPRKTAGNHGRVAAVATFRRRRIAIA